MIPYDGYYLDSRVLTNGMEIQSDGAHWRVVVIFEKRLVWRVLSVSRRGISPTILFANLADGSQFRLLATKAHAHRADQLLKKVLNKPFTHSQLEAQDTQLSILRLPSALSSGTRTMMTTEEYDAAFLKRLGIEL
jgi:hypothetical protein